MRANQARYPVAKAARLLGVSPSGFYAWRDREPSPRQQYDEVLKACIGNIHQRSRGTYGALRVHAELAAGGVHVGRKRVARLMREMGLTGISRRKGARTTRRDDRLRPAPDLVERQFEADAPDRLWVADIIYVPTWAGFLFLAVVVDACSRCPMVDNHILRINNSRMQRKRPQDPNQLAKLVVDIATGEVSEPADTPIAERARKAGKRGGPARANKLTPKQRTDIVRAAANVRWKKS